MSEHITHVAVFEDCMRLALRSNEIAEPLKISLRNYPGLARFTSIARGGDGLAIELIRNCRERWETRRPGDFVEETLSYVIGWRCHNAADRHFKPIYRVVEAERYEGERGGDIDMAGPGESRIYHDIVVFREVYQCGAEPGWPAALLDYRMESHPASDAVSPLVLEDLLGGLLQSTLLETQSFLGKTGDVDAWFDELLDSYQPFTVDLKRYAEAYYSPELEEMRRFIIENNFYDRSDPLIQLARSIQLGSPDTSIDLGRAVEAAANQSQYAQAVRKAYNHLVASSEYFLHRIDEKQLRLRLDLDKPHVPRG
jgi:hypothetical protein